MYERERKSVCVCVSVCVCARERERERESVCVCVCVRERESVSVCVCVCVCVRERERENGGGGGSASCVLRHSKSVPGNEIPRLHSFPFVRLSTHTAMRVGVGSEGMNGRRVHTLSCDNTRKSGCKLARHLLLYQESGLLQNG